ncbi:hypothetical protein [Yersinia intermedia]|uniref:hypothetical protein n=1 Tax=Yersinia intermedia TaxID=631 RepID=UPI00065D5343|nr:hypothetical protein [Yersinia intermedia]CRY84302.1 Uncharacterised protein [Yersinia intermedia]
MKHDEPKELISSESGPIAPGIIKKSIKIEIDEKLLWKAIIIALILSASFYLYKKIPYFHLQSWGGSSLVVAVMDMDQIKNQFDSNSTPSVNNNFTSYLRKLMALYRAKDILVLDIKQVFAVPSSVEIVVFIEPEKLSEELAGAGIDESKFENLPK